MQSPKVAAFMSTLYSSHGCSCCGRTGEATALPAAGGDLGDSPGVAHWIAYEAEREFVKFYRQGRRGRGEKIGGHDTTSADY